MKKILFAIIYVTSSLLLVGIILSQNPYKYGNPTSMISMVTGVCAYVWINLQYLIVSKPRFITSHLKMSWVFMFHGTMSIIALGFAALHQVINEEIFGEGLITKLGEGAIVIFAVATGFSILTMASPLSTIFKPLNSFRKLIAKLPFYKYKYVKWLHNTVLGGILLMTAHVLMTGSVQRNKIVFATYVLYFAVPVLMYVVSKLRIIRKEPTLNYARINR